MTRHIHAVLLVVAVGLPQYARAAETFDPVAAAETVAPYLDEQTIAVIRLDLARIDPSAVLEKWVELMPVAKRDADDLRPVLARWRDAMTDAGNSEVYVVVSLADVPIAQPVIVAPKRGGADGGPLVSRLNGLLSTIATLKAIDNGDAVIIASPQALARIARRQPDPRPQLAAALEAAGDHALQVVLLPTDNDRQVIEELMPTLPAVVGEGPSTMVTRGVRWLALGIDAQTPWSLSLTAQSADAASAAALANAWNRAAETIAVGDDLPLRPLGSVLKQSAPDVSGDRIELRLGDHELAAVLAAAQPSVLESQTSHWRREAMSRVTKLADAVYSFQLAKKRFPAFATFSASGQPLLSWRVQMLPFLGETDLYGQFHLDEPWDSEHNRPLIAKMPEMFLSPASKHRAVDGLATYREVVGPHTAFPGREPIEWKQITDKGVTILLVEVDDDHAVTWTKPEGLPFNPEHPSTGMGGQFKDGFYIADCGGGGRFLSNPPIDDEDMRGLLTIDGGETISW
jgi:hypothetical protein